MEGGSGGMAAETTERDGGSDGDSMGGTALRIWINLTLGNEYVFWGLQTCGV